MTYEFLTLDLEDGIATLTLNRPPVNVLHIVMLSELEKALRSLATNDEVRTLILAAAGKLFSAGVDIADHTPDKVGEMIPLFHRVCRALASFPVPTIAAVQGHALGGGCELVICCDLAVLAQDAKIGQPEIQLAAVAPVAALRLQQLVGFRAAADILFTGRNLSAEEAREMGLVNAVQPAEDVGNWAREKAAAISGLSRAAMVLLKRSLLKGFGDWAGALDEVENMYLIELMQTEDAREGLQAFMEKRPPVWKHR